MKITFNDSLETPYSVDGIPAAVVAFDGGHSVPGGVEATGVRHSPVAPKPGDVWPPRTPTSTPATVVALEGHMVRYTAGPSTHHLPLSSFLYYYNPPVTLLPHSRWGGTLYQAVIAGVEGDTVTYCVLGYPGIQRHSVSRFRSDYPTRMPDPVWKPGDRVLTCNDGVHIIRSVKGSEVTFTDGFSVAAAYLLQAPAATVQYTQLDAKGVLLKDSDGLEFRVRSRGIVGNIAGLPLSFRDESGSFEILAGGRNIGYWEGT